MTTYGACGANANMSCGSFVVGNEIECQLHDTVDRNINQVENIQRPQHVCNAADNQKWFPDDKEVST